jgi:hypothetical protein
MAELLKQLSEQTTRLVHQELELAKAELTQKGRQAGAGVRLFGATGAIGLLVAAAALTTETLKEDVQWARTQARPAKT